MDVQQPQKKKELGRNVRYPYHSNNGHARPKRTDIRIITTASTASARLYTFCINIPFIGKSGGVGAESWGWYGCDSVYIDTNKGSAPNSAGNNRVGVCPATNVIGVRSAPQRGAPQVNRWYAGHTIYKAKKKLEFRWLASVAVSQCLHANLTYLGWVGT